MSERNQPAKEAPDQPDSEGGLNQPENNPEEQQEDGEAESMVDLFPDRGLTTEEYYSVIGDERIEEHDPLYETGPEGRLGSFIIKTSSGDWIGYHYIEPARQWTRTYAGMDYEFVKKAHQLYVAQDRRMWDERSMTGEEETDQDVDVARDSTPTMDDQSTNQ